MRVKEITKWGLVAGAYAVLCLITIPIGSGMLQIRPGEALMMLPFYNRKSSVGLIIGCLFINMFSAMGAVDMIFGTLATALFCFVAGRTKQRWLVPVYAGVINGIIIGVMLYFMIQTPLILSILSVGISEFLMVCIGLFLFRQLERHPWFQENIGDV